MDYVIDLERSGILPVETIPSPINPAPQPVALPTPVLQYTLPPDHGLSPGPSIETVSPPPVIASLTLESPTLEEDLIDQLLSEGGTMGADEDMGMTDEENESPPGSERQDKGDGEEYEEEDSEVSSSSSEVVPIRSKRKARLSFDGVEIT